MRKLLFLLAFAAMACDPASHFNKKDPEPEPAPVVESSFAKGADLGWITEMESRGLKFYTKDGKEKECTALMQEIGFNAVRCRVWVNPSNGWCNCQDVVDKGLRAQKLGMKVMIDFHYADSWADPGKQPVPAAWSGHKADQLAEDVAAHTKEVLAALKSAGVDVAWVQVGNEITNGMLWEECRVSGQEAANFVKVFNAGYKAVKGVYKDAVVIVHTDRGENWDVQDWFYSLMSKSGLNYDMIGLSHYPSYWDSSIGGYPDWKAKTPALVANVKKLHEKFGADVMLCEVGMPASEPAKAKECLQYIFDNTESLDYFKGIFYWEPESEKARCGYEYGAFSGGKPTEALDPFSTNR